MLQDNMTSNGSSLFRRLAQGVVAFGSRNVFLIAMDFLAAVLLIRLLPVADYGQLTLTLSVRSVAVVFLSWGLGQFIATEIARSRGKDRPDQVKRLLLRFGQMNVLTGGMFLALSVAAYWPARQLFTPLIAWLALVVGVDLFITAWRNVIDTTFYGYAFFAYQSFLAILESFFKVGLIALLIVLARMEVRGAILIYPLSTLVALSLVLPAWLRIVGSLKQVPASREPVFRQGLRGPGKWVVALRPLKQIRDQLPLWLVNQILGISDVAVFAVARKGYNYTSILLSPLQAVLLPLLSESADTDQGTTYQLVHNSIKYALVGAVVFAAVGWLLSPFIYDVVFEYPTAVPIYRILLFCLPVYALALHQRPMFYALRGQKYLVISILFSIIWLVLVMSLSIIWLGVIGAAVGLFANVFVVWGLRYMFIRRLRPEFHIAWRDLLRIEERDRKLFAWIWRRVFRR